MRINSLIRGTGSYFPDIKVPNEYFLENEFLDKKGNKINKDPHQIIEKLVGISGIKERRYIAEDQDTADLGAQAALRALDDSGLEMDQIDGLIVSHNFGNVPPGENQGYLVPNLAAVIKGRMGIMNPKCFAYDILFGCPGWLESTIIAHQYLRNERVQNILIVGVEVISRMLDPHDMDSMLFGDGAGAIVLSGEKSDTPKGILGYNTYSHCQKDLEYLKYGYATHPGPNGHPFLTVKMQGHQVFKYAVSNMPPLIIECLNDAKIDINDVAKFLFHQANEKMINKIAANLFKTMGVKGSIEEKVPFMIERIGNSSVATIPTVLDHIMKGNLKPHEIQDNDLVVMASVGAGMHCNCMIYKF